MQQNKSILRNGFTLIEMMIVVAIIAILASVAGVENLGVFVMAKRAFHDGLGSEDAAVCILNPGCADDFSEISGEVVCASQCLSALLSRAFYFRMSACLLD